MATFVGKSSWIARQWKRGWDNIPVVMMCHCVTVPLFVYTVAYKFLNRNNDLPTEKYRMFYTVLRPDDPAIKRINHESRIDIVGLTWPRLPHKQYIKPL